MDKELTIAFKTLGCKVNQYESEAMQKIFEIAGYKVIEDFSLANIIVINTCTVTAVSSQKSRQTIRRMINMNENAVIVVVGCYSQSEPENVLKIDGVDVVLGTENRANIVKLVEQILMDRKLRLSQVRAINEIGEFENLPHIPHRTRAFLKIEDGCENFCSYCIIPFVRGKVRSRSLENIHEECLQLRRNGFKEIVLTGIHIGAYGKDLKDNVDITDVIKLVLETANPLRLRLSSIESLEVTDKLIKLMRNDSRICNHLHLPLQSGCNKILNAMHRRYTKEEFSNLTTHLIEEISEISIGTDLIVGFPGETEEDFQETLNFIRKQPFNKIHVFPFSARPGTIAALMKNQIPSKLKKERVACVSKISRMKSKKLFESLIGTTVKIIAETRKNRVVDGLTSNYVRVYTVDDKIELGEVIKIKVERLYNDGIFGMRISD